MTHEDAVQLIKAVQHAADVVALFGGIYMFWQAVRYILGGK